MVSLIPMNHLLNNALARVGVALAWVRRAGAPLLSLRVGIAVRLTAAFAAVIILAAAANFLAEQGVAIVERSEPVPVVQSPPAPVATVEPTPQPAVKVAAVAPPQRVSSAPVVVAIDQLSQAIHSALQSSSSEDRNQVRQSSAALTSAGEHFLQQVGRARPRSVATLNQDIASYSQQGGIAVAVAEQRREATRDYVACVEAMNIRVKQSLDGAWKIFGRVVTRQSLIKLGAGVDDIRRQSGALATPDGYNPETIAAIEAVESQFAKTLEENARDFGRADGGDWLRQMREDYARMVRLRIQVVDLDGRRRDAERQLQFSRARLLASLPESVLLPAATRAPSAAPPPSPATAKATVARSSGALGQPPPVTSEPAAVAAVVQKLPEAAVAKAARDGKRSLVAWLSAAVLLFVVSISAFTVRSIVGPVRRLLRATSEIAAGAMPAPIPRGGIKELDTLAVAFNDMARRLGIAQDLTLNHQRDLEVKVEQRTRELRTLAERDPLTLLPNRRQLFVLLNEALVQAEARGSLVGVFFVDIDNFKNLNDSVDHVFGDRVLVGIARRLEKVAEGFGFAARLGGDEFTIVHAGAEKAEDIRLAGIALLEAFNEPLLIDERELHVSISVGASVFPEHDRDAESLLRAADAALFRAKALGRNQLSIFTPDLLRAMAEKFTTEQGLRRAIERGEFELVFQPELNLDTMRVSLCEALVRWRMPDGRLASPQEFLAVAEESGLILDISSWVLRAAVEAAAHWHHGEWPEACVAINISPRQLLDRQFTESLLALLAEHDLPPDCIELELTETVLQTGATTIETLKRLKACGFAIALDDFGTGYSSLASLEQLPISRIKLDRSLISGIDTTARSAAITRAIILLCQGLDLHMTAEGVERAEQLRELSGFRGLCVQGYLFSKPVAQDELLDACRRVEQDAARLMTSFGESELLSAEVPRRKLAV